MKLPLSYALYCKLNNMTITTTLYKISESSIEIEFHDSTEYELFGINTINLPYHTCVAIVTWYLHKPPKVHFNLVTKKNTLEATLSLQSYQQNYYQLFIDTALNLVTENMSNSHIT